MLLFCQVINHVAVETDATVHSTRLKSIFRACNKAALHFRSDMSRVTDILGARVTCDSFESMLDTVAFFLGLDPSLEQISATLRGCEKSPEFASRMLSQRISRLVSDSSASLAVDRLGAELDSQGADFDDDDDDDEISISSSVRASSASALSASARRGRGMKKHKIQMLSASNMLGKKWDRAAFCFVSKSSVGLSPACKLFRFCSVQNGLGIAS